MPEMVLRLEIDPATGEKRVVVDYVSDGDALPMEHEDDHADLVDALLEHADRDGVAVSRDGGGKPIPLEQESQPAGRESVSEGEG